MCSAVGIFTYFLFGSCGGVPLSYNGTYGSVGGAFRVISFAVITLVLMEFMEPVIGKGRAWFSQISYRKFQ